jgi:translation elongation factor EF-Tu-like GTPase
MLPPIVGYRGQFFYEDNDCDATYIFDDGKSVSFDRFMGCEIHVMNPSHLDHFSIGMPFLIREGSQTVAYGIISVIESETA